MAAVSSSQMATNIVPRASVWGVQSAFAAYSGAHSTSVSDEIQMLRLPRNAIVDMVRVGGNVGVAGLSYNVGDDAGSKTRYGVISLSAATLTVTAIQGLDYHYSLSDDDREVTMLLTLATAASATASVSVHMQVLYHMP